VQPPRLVQPHPSMSLWFETSRLPQHLNRPVRPTKSPELPCVEVRQHSSRPTSENRCHPPALSSETLVPEGVDPLMQRNQQSSPAATQHNFFVDSSLQQLPRRHDPVLPFRKRSNTHGRVPMLHQHHPPPQTASTFLPASPES
jgi:hypothetical protein